MTFRATSRVAPWPTPQDYSEAVQSPQLSFSDSDLRAGTAATTALGLPSVIAGNFACVFRFRCGARDWAVRCFLRELPDQEERYAEIGKHLQAVRLPYTVGFQFIRQGVLVRGRWYPILKMEWVQGQTLPEYVADHLHDAAVLAKLAESWLAMIQALQSASIGHGDLQHGNVLVVGNQLRVIDYDAMYVPALNGKTSHEIGHRNYQHPRRTAAHFGPYIDNFSAWVVYLSIIGLTAEPPLRAGFSATNEWLLLKQEDFDRPWTSPSLTALARNSDARIQALTSSFRSLLALEPAQVPRPTPLPPIATPTPVTPETVRPLPSGAPIDSSWITDAVFAREPAQERAVKPPPRLFRFLVIGLIFAAASVWGATFAGVVLLTPLYFLILGTVPVLLALAVLCVCYGRDELVKERRQARERLARAFQAQTALDRIFDSADERKTQLRALDADARAELTRRRQAIRDREQAELARVREDATQLMRSVEARRSEVSRRQQQELNVLQRGAPQEIASMNSQLSRVGEDEQRELEATLKRIQNDFVQQRLSRVYVHSAPVGDTLIQRLREARIRTAYDVQYGRVLAVPGFGPKRSQALAQWRLDLERQAKNQVPRGLGASETQAIKVKHATRRSDLIRRRDEHQQRLAAEEAAIKARTAAAVQQLRQEEATIQSETAQRSSEVSRRYSQEHAGLDRDAVALDERLAKQVAELDQSIVDEQRKRYAVNWELAETRHALTAFRSVTFGRYLLSVVRLAVRTS